MVDGIINKHIPVYNIKAVSRLIGLLPVTLRAWERRYGIPVPRRGNQGYRLYSDYEVRILKWLKLQIDSGLSISRAVDYLNELRLAGKDPAAQEETGNSMTPPVSLQFLAVEFSSAIRRLDEQTAGEILSRAFLTYSIDRVLLEVMQTTLVNIGDAWEKGELPIATEHFASQLCIQQLHNLIHSMPAPSRQGLIVAACAPKELHQIGLLMLVTLLRMHGWDVRYLGPDLDLDRVEESLSKSNPDLFMISATRRQSVHELDSLAQVIAKFPDPQPLIVLGGQAFYDNQLPENIPAIYLRGNAAESANRIDEIMTSMHKPGQRGNLANQAQTGTSRTPAS
jgi:MerR family transcriptional regulator, light-induced transcriptional regulator